MNAISYSINGLLAVAVAVLFYLHFKDAKPTSAVLNKADNEKTSSNIAYIDVDSLEAHYIYFKEKKAELEKRQKQIENELATRAENLQRKAYDLQQKAPTLTQSEGEAIQAKLIQEQQELEQKRESMTSSFLNEQAEFNKNINNKLDSFLLDYNKDKKYVYILSYIKGQTILYKDPANDITKEVIAGMNERYKKK